MTFFEQQLLQNTLPHDLQWCYGGGREGERGRVEVNIPGRAHLIITAEGPHPLDTCTYPHPHTHTHTFLFSSENSSLQAIQLFTWSLSTHSELVCSFSSWSASCHSDAFCLQKERHHTSKSTWRPAVMAVQQQPVTTREGRTLAA